VRKVMRKKSIEERERARRTTLIEKLAKEEINT
jgi:hypothetical protein